MKTPQTGLLQPDDSVGPEGAHPAKQERSRVLRDKLIASGRALIEAGGFANTSMADIARGAGCSVGALYFRFHNKESLFDSVVEVAMGQAIAELDARVSQGRYAGLPLEETASICVQDYMAFVQQNAGLLRALYQRNMEDPRYWAMVRGTAELMVNTWARSVAVSAGRPDDRSLIRRIGIAFNFVSSVLVYSVLIVPPIMTFKPEDMLFWLMEMVMHFIKRTDDAAARKRLPKIQSAALWPRERPRAVTIKKAASP